MSSISKIPANKIDVNKLKVLLEDAEEPITPRFILTIINSLIGLEKQVEIDYVWLTMEKKFNINIARKDTLSAAIAFYDNPAEFFSNPNVFDKMSIAFNGHNIVKDIINKPHPMELTYAVVEARDIMKDLWDNKYADSYPLFPEVATYAASVYHDNGMVAFHPVLSSYQYILSGLNSYNKDIDKEVKEILTIFQKVKNKELDLKDIILANNFVSENVVQLTAIDVYINTLKNYTESLLFKIIKK